jgi:hypothetical protein
MESKPLSLILLDYLLARLSPVLVPLASAKVSAMQENLKSYSKE